MALEKGNPTYGVVLVTAPSEKVASAIARHLIDSHLAACVSLMPVQSLYKWEGEVHQDQEWQLIIKTDLKHFEILAQQIQAHHHYEVPEIIALPIVAGSEAYLQWIGANVLDTPPS